MNARARPSQPVPIYQQLAAELQQLIEAKSLRPGQRLPSVRTTARQRQISVGTVIQAYVSLENRGYVTARPKSGYFVSRRPLAARQGAAPAPETPMGVTAEDLAGHILRLSCDSHYFPLGTACPDPKLFPLERLARTAASIGRSDPGVYGRHALGQPYEPLRQELSRRYLAAGAAIAHSEFIITSGCGESLHLALAAVTRPGDVVLVESPAYFGYLQIIASLGLKAVEIPTDPSAGISLEALRVALEAHAAKALIITPSFQNPTGACLTNARKQELYAILCDYNVVAIEDDIYGELHFGAERPKPLKAWDTEGRVLLCSSLSKSLTPGISLGWLAAGAYRDRIEAAKWAEASMLSQRIAARFLQEGFDRHLRQLRARFRSQLESARKVIAAAFPKGTRITEPRGGYLLWVELPVTIDAVKLREAALREKIGLAPGPAFTLRDRYRHCLRVNCGLPWTAEFERALKLVGRLAAFQHTQAGRRP